MDHCARSKLLEISAAKVKRVTRSIFVIPNICHAEQFPSMPYPKSEKIGCQRGPYFANFQYIFSLVHCVCPKLPEISAAKVQRVRRRITFFAKRNAKCNEHQGRLPCFFCILHFNHQHLFFFISVFT